jgi:hypothetical protein
MSEGDCAECRALLEVVTLTTRNQFGAIARHDTAVYNGGADDEEIAVAKHQVDFCALEHQNAVDRYQFHLRTHQVVMGAISETRVP